MIVWIVVYDQYYSHNTVFITILYVRITILLERFITVFTTKVSSVDNVNLLYTVGFIKKRKLLSNNIDCRQYFNKTVHNNLNGYDFPSIARVSIIHSTTLFLFLVVLLQYCPSIFLHACYAFKIGWANLDKMLLNMVIYHNPVSIMLWGRLLQIHCQILLLTLYSPPSRLTLKC